VVLDDSIMRGTTMRKIIKMFRLSGAKEIHVRITAPPTRYPCFYGIDIPTKKELIASTHSIEEIRKYLRVDSVEYMTVETLLHSLDRPNMNFCCACFNGDYPCELEKMSEESNQKFLFEDMGMQEYY
jgi:amidophosphoribosyltransferase